jgi:ubiquinone/menaquinone biosynthesis C-methylase UbiE
MDRAEFDLIANEYQERHSKNIRISGESPDFFARYKVLDAAFACAQASAAPRVILDFGCGIGNSVPHFAEAFPAARLISADVSARSLDIARSRFPEATGAWIEIGARSLPLADRSVDLCFAACVFHHIEHAEHRFWLSELLRVTRSGGLLMLYEHNPLNPLTRRAVNTCEFDRNARLIHSERLHAAVTESGWQSARVTYRMFFPRQLRVLRRFERLLARVPLGAQYHVVARK